MTEYDPRWHVEEALALLVALEDWESHNDRYRQAAVRTARRRLERALAHGEPAPSQPDATTGEESGGAV